MKNYQKDLKREVKYWIPYEQCTEQEYYNQELKIIPLIEKLLMDKTICDICTGDGTEQNEDFVVTASKENKKETTDKSYLEKKKIIENKKYHRGVLIESYKARCWGKKDTLKKNLYSDIRAALKQYSYQENADIEQFLLSNIPINYLKPYDALNILGLKWCLDKEKEEYKKCVNQAYIYIAEMCYDRFGECDTDSMEELIIKMVKELNLYKPEKQELGSFISARMKNRKTDVWRKLNGQKTSRKKIPETAEIKIKEIMMVDTITISGMERTNYSSVLQKGQYAIGIDKIYFSKEDIGKRVSIKYIEDVVVKERQLEEKQRAEEGTLGEENKMLISFAARVLNYKNAYNEKIRVQTQWERRKLCFTEKLVYTVKKYACEERNLEVDAKKVLDRQYLDFFMSEANLADKEFFLERLQEVPLKHKCDLLEDEKENELKWNKKGWLEAKVPQRYFFTIKNKKVVRSTITEFRNEYGEWLLMLLKQRMKGERGERE